MIHSLGCIQETHPTAIMLIGKTSTFEGNQNVGMSEKGEKKVVLVKDNVGRRRGEKVEKKQ